MSWLSTWFVRVKAGVSKLIFPAEVDKRELVHWLCGSCEVFFGADSCLVWISGWVGLMYACPSTS